MLFNDSLKLLELSTTGVWKIVSENGIANVDNEHILTSEQRDALNAAYKKL